MPATALPLEAWILIALIAAWCVLLCLKTLGDALEYKVSMHDLKFQAYQLRARQNQMIEELAAHKATWATPATQRPPAEPTAAAA